VRIGIGRWEKAAIKRFPRSFARQGAERLRPGIVKVLQTVQLLL
jgi:hypothetical protein